MYLMVEEKKISPTLYNNSFIEIPEHWYRKQANEMYVYLPLFEKIALVGPKKKKRSVTTTTP